MFIACAGAAALGTVPVMMPGAAGTTPPLAWQDVREIRILCLVSGGEPNRLQLQDELCRRVGALARVDAPAPVAPIGFGDPAILERDVATLLVHANVQSGSEPLLVVSVRPFRGGGAERAIFFGSAPRAVPMPSSGALPEDADALLGSALDEVLPWRQPR